MPHFVWICKIVPTVLLLVSNLRLAYSGFP